jgi:class 3 adenylate cyclase
MVAGTDSPSRQLLESIDYLDLTPLYVLWRTHDKQAWQDSPKAYAKLATRLLRSGEPLLAFDVISEALTVWPSDSSLIVLEALALARCGASERANIILTTLYAAGHRDEETVSILARTHKDLWLGALDGEAKRRHLVAAEKAYTEAFDGDRCDRYWSGINAAALALFLDKKTEAEARARGVQQICQRLLSDDTGQRSDRYWLYASLGEAALIQADYTGAMKWYQTAATEAKGGYGDVASTRRNARLILEWQRQDKAFLDRCLPAPQVVVFSGHMIDGDPSRVRFPADSEPHVYEAIKSYLMRTEAKVGFSSAACGSDILFLEALLELEAEINIVLPSDPESFAKASVEACGGGAWLDRFQNVLHAAKQVILASENSAGEVFLAYANILLYGLAKSRARQIDGTLSALTVWDGAAGKTGGTASAIDLWRDCGQTVRAIHPVTLVESELTARIGAMAPSDTWLCSASPKDSESARALVSMLFADAVGFSKLTEQQIPKFVTYFLGRIAELVARADCPPIVRNTWGDALYFVFNDISAAGRLALDLCDLVAATDWPEFGLPAEFNIRIGLHSGPAYPITDPIIHQFSYTGVHVSRAARIEPITPPGAVYASQPFAALAEAVGVRAFACDYVGQTALAKHFGQYPTFRVRRLSA